MNNLINTQKVLAILLALIGVTALIASIFTKQAHLVFIGVSSVVLSTLLFNDKSLQQ
jgi:general stress protein CsbA